MHHALDRRALLGMASGTAGAMALPAWGQALNYPNRPVTLVVPFSPGGAVDISAQAIAEKLSRLLKQPMVVDNRAGAAGATGCSAVAKAPADGYTLIVASQSTHVANPAVTRSLPYDAINDFAPITLIDRLANVLLVNAALPVKTFPEFVKFVKARPGKWSYASSGNGTMAHLSMELLKTQLGLFITHIPYRGAGPALADLLSGQVQMSWNNLTSNLAMIQNGRLRALAVASPIRTPQLPDVPTFNELKLPDLNLTSWTGLAAPARTPEPIIQLLYQSVRTIMRDPQTQEAWRSRGAMIPENVRPDEYRREIIQRIAFYQNVAKANKIVIE